MVEGLVGWLPGVMVGCAQCTTVLHCSYSCGKVSMFGWVHFMWAISSSSCIASAVGLSCSGVSLVAFLV